MGLKFSKADKIEEVRVRQLPSPEDREELAAVLTDEPDNAFANLDWGVYLSYVEKNCDEAEQYFVYAMELDRYSARCVGYYALFQELERKNIEKAGELYKKGYDDIICKKQVLGDDEVNFMCNYAIYQRNALKNPQLADQTYKKLVAANPNHAIAHGDFGILLKDDISTYNAPCHEYERAEHHLQKAAELEPNVAHWQLAYANFLKTEKKDAKAAKKYFDAAKTAKAFQKQKEKEREKREKDRIKRERKAMKDSFG